jgi:hypothetical protein
MVRARGTLTALAVATRNENVRRVEVAWGAAIVAEWAHFVALGVFAYRGGGASAVGVAGLVRLLPAATSVSALALAGSAAASFAHERLLVYGFASLVGLSSTLIRPTLQALLPSLARTPHELIASNGATSTIESLGTLVGPLLAGVLVSVAGVGVVFAAGGAAVLAGAALLTRVNVEGRIEPAEAARPRAGRQLAAGFGAIARVRGTRLVVLLMVAQTFVRGCLNVLIVVAAFRFMHAGAGAVGYLTAAIGVGGLAGALGAMTLSGRRLAASFALSLVCWGVPIALIAPRPVLAVALVLLAVVGAANSVEDVAGFTLLQRTVADQHLSRVLGIFWGLAMGAVALGSLAAPALVGALGPRGAFLLVGSILPLVTLGAYRGLTLLDRRSDAAGELELIDRVPMFAPLSIAAKEHLAARLIPVSVAAGTQVVCAGEIGDRFYMLDEGALDIDVDGRHEAAGANDYFGEIALLRDMPRTATVTATADSRLYALERADFLAAVTGHSAARAVGQGVVDARLRPKADASPTMQS